MTRNFYPNNYVQGCNNFGTAIVDGNFPASASYIDVSGFYTFCFLVRAGALDSALTLQVKQDTSATETASIKNITDATVTVGTGDDNGWASIEVEVAKLDIANGFRYVTLAVSGAAGSNDYLDIIFLGRLPRTAPVTQSASYFDYAIVAG